MTLSHRAPAEGQRQSPPAPQRDGRPVAALATALGVALALASSPTPVRGSTTGAATSQPTSPPTAPSTPRITAASLASTAAAATFEIVRIGLYDAEHPTAPRLQDSLHSIAGINGRGQVIGGTYRYNEYGRRAGLSGWLYDGERTVRLGLFDLPQGPASANWTYVRALGASGQVTGTSSQGDSGPRAWFYDGLATREIGLRGAAYVDVRGRSEDSVEGMNARGQVIGTSKGNAVPGEYSVSAWQYRGGTTREIGLLDAEHTGLAGQRRNEPIAINEAGQVVGSSRRYAPGWGGDNGESAWLQTGSTVRRIGLTDAAHTAGRDGMQRSQVVALNERGQSIGRSTLGAEYFGRGQSAWFDDGRATRRIGLWDGIHAKVPDGPHSEAIALNDTGQAIGVSWGWNGQSTGLKLTYTAWRFDGSVSKPIGPTDAAHQRPDGLTMSTPVALNDAGHVVGTSWLFAGPGRPEYGYSAWWTDGDTVQRMGLTDAAHTAPDGRQDSHVYQLNAAGQALGDSLRYGKGGSDFYDYEPWFFDPATGQTELLAIEGQRVRAYYLTDDGTVFGSYTVDTSAWPGSRVFSWTLDGGYVDLGKAVAGGLRSNGWNNLYAGVVSEAGTHVAGLGLLADRTAGAYLLQPTAAVPEPATALLWLGGGMLLVARARRRAV